MNTAENLVKEVVILSIVPTRNGNAQATLANGNRVFVSKSTLDASGVDLAKHKGPLFGFAKTETIGVCKPIDANTPKDTQGAFIREQILDDNGVQLTTQRESVVAMFADRASFITTANASFDLTIDKVLHRQERLATAGLTPTDFTALAQASF